MAGLNQVSGCVVVVLARPRKLVLMFVCFFGLKGGGGCGAWITRVRNSNY